MNWVELLAGVVFLAIGILIVIFRKQLAEFNAASLRGYFGAAGDRTARRSTPVQIAITGIIFVGISIFLIVSSFG
jgi:hypothetical protein